jgi:hypothetical protein
MLLLGGTPMAKFKIQMILDCDPIIPFVGKDATFVETPVFDSLTTTVCEALKHMMEDLDDRQNDSSAWVRVVRVKE